MAATKLTAAMTAKPWGRHDLAPWADSSKDRIGEMAYAGGDDAPLLVKALFTGERLSVQVHPGDKAARARGLARGKDEAWIILAAEPGATIGLGLLREVSLEELAQAAADGSIEDLVDWKPAQAGDVFFAPAGTIHAIGAGLTLIEVQQNLDLTYRLYDYGRPRELHLGEAVKVADRKPWRSQPAPRPFNDGRVVLVDSPNFVVERVRFDGPATLAPPDGRTAWLIVLHGSGTVAGAQCSAGEVWLIDDPARLDLTHAEVLLAYAGAGVARSIWTAALGKAA